MFKGTDLTIESGKTFFLIMWLDTISGDDCSKEKSFMDIDTTANRINNFHDKPPFKR